MKIFLTGASGFLGSHLAEELIRSGHQIKALIRRTSQIDPLKSLPIEWIEGSLPSIQHLRKALNSCDAVIHAAGLVKALSKKDFFQVNAFGTEQLVEEVLQAENKPKIFIYISTIAVHNASKDNSRFDLPWPQCRPISTYGKSKLAGEKALERLKGKVKTHILRPPVLYGPRDKELLFLFKAIEAGIVPSFGLGNRALSLCYASDVVQAILTLMKSNLPSDSLFCLDDGEAYSWKRMIQIISKVANKKTISLPIPPLIFRMAAYLSETLAKITQKPSVFTLEKFEEMKQSHWICGYEKLNRATGWLPKIKLEQGARTTLSFYTQEKWI